MSLSETILSRCSLEVSESFTEGSKIMGAVLLVKGRVSFVTILPRGKTAKEIHQILSDEFEVLYVGYYQIHRYKTPHRSELPKYRCWLLSMDKLNFYLSTKLAVVANELPKVSNLTCKKVGSLRLMDEIEFNNELKDIIRDSISSRGFESYL